MSETVKLEAENKQLASENKQLFSELTELVMNRPHDAAHLLKNQTKELTRLSGLVEELVAAIEDAVYEATHLSPQEQDGAHYAKMSASWLARARNVLSRAREGV